MCTPYGPNPSDSCTPIPFRFPLAGDDLYGGHLDYIRRQALHAGYLAFTHPMTQEYVELRAPLPTDMKDLLCL